MNQEAINIITALRKELDLMKAELNIAIAGKAESDKQNICLKNEISELKRMIFGSKSERFRPESPIGTVVPSLFDLPPVTGIDTKQIQQSDKANEKQTTGKVKKLYKRTGRNEFPAHLERREIVHEPEMDLTGYVLVGKNESKRLDYQPAKLIVNVHIYPKYKKIEQESPAPQFVQAGTVNGPIESGIPEAGLVAAIAVDKFLYHMPIDRQIKRFGYMGVKFAPGTVNGWMESIFTLLTPLLEEYKILVKNSKIVQADESHIRVRDLTKKGKTHRGWLWFYRDPVTRRIYIEYQKGRDRSGPVAYLKDYSGFLLVDGYSVYEDSKIGGRKEIYLVHCHAHARRYFEKSIDYDRVRAEYYLTEIQKVYKIEAEIKEQNLSPEQIVQIREQQALPILNALGEWLKSNLAEVIPNTPISKAIQYALSRWDKLMEYTHHHFIPIDNNQIESAVRPLSLGRKNFMFAGSHHGAERIALMYTLMANCKEHNVDPYEYLKDVLSRISNHKQKNIKELLPENWKPLSQDIHQEDSATKQCA
jgi:transposase